MSHFALLVTNTNVIDIKQQLAPFDENLETPKHISITKTDFIKRGKDEVEYAKKKLAEFDKDPEAYEASCVNPGHMQWLKGKAREAAKITDDEGLFRLGSSWLTEDLDADGNYWSTRNDDAKWDWYTVGGRWAGFFVPKANSESGRKGEITLLASSEQKLDYAINNRVDVIKVKDIDWESMDALEKERRGKYFSEEMSKDGNLRFKWDDNRDEILKMTCEEYINQPITHSTFAVLHEGRWYERGDMGWFGIASNEKDTGQWETEWHKLVDSLDPETEVTIVDCHI